MDSHMYLSTCPAHEQVSNAVASMKAMGPTQASADPAMAPGVMQGGRRMA